MAGSIACSKRGKHASKRLKYQLVPMTWIAGVCIPILTFGGGILLKVWSVADQIATKAELNILREDVVTNFKRTDEAIAKSVTASKQYTDEKYIQTKDEYRQYSDSNKLKMDSKYAAIEGQQTLILALLQDLKVTLNSIITVHKGTENGF